jgi:MoxR-like ATPase
VGKTEVARALAAATGAALIRLQCHEGIDLHHAVYDWDYQRQLLAIRAAEAGAPARELFGPEFLLRRPLLEALESDPARPAVLLIDEIDRADDEFEAFLLQLLAEGAVTIPELGTIEATVPPIVVLTSNRTRDLHDALKRRCLYHWIDYPPLATVVRIVRRRTPAAGVSLADQVATAVARLRTLDLQKPPGIAESIDWSRALTLLGIDHLTPETAAPTLTTVLKYREDQHLAHTHGLAHLTAP